MEPRIAELLVKGGIVSREQLSEAQNGEKENNSTIAKEIVRLGLTTEDTLFNLMSGRGKAKAWKKALATLEPESEGR
jgi:hypothetical protein